jgi:hypothetical protein
VLAHPEPVLALVARMQPPTSTEAQTGLGVYGQEYVGALDLPLRVPAESV